MTLSFEDVMHYQRIIYVLQQTEQIMQEIDTRVFDLYGLTPEEREIVMKG